jgi:hypothetical protein
MVNFLLPGHLYSQLLVSNKVRRSDWMVKFKRSNLLLLSQHGWGISSAGSSNAISPVERQCNAGSLRIG